MIKNTLLLIIRFYQSHLSIKKGYCCAYSVLHSDKSCSHAIIDIINENRLSKIIPTVYKRFFECYKSSKKLKKRKEYKDRHKDGAECCVWFSLDWWFSS